MKWIKEHKKICIALAVVLVIVIVVLAIRHAGMKALESLGSESETAAIERRTLMETVSATGSFVAGSSADVSAEISNTKFATINVEVGDTVSVGQVIATMDTEALQERYDDANKNLDDSRKQAQRNRDNAQRNLEEAAKNRDESLANVDTDIADAYTDWQDAKTAYENKKKQLDDLTEQMATLTVDNANYGALSSQKNTLETEVKTSQTTMERYERTYNDRVNNREDRIKTINDNYQTQVDNYNTTMENADSASDSQQEQVDNLAEQLANATVRSPANGIVTSVNYDEGDTYNGGNICVIQDVSSFDVTTEIDEYDINKIQVGQEVVIRTNATGDAELSGTVKSVSPIATGSSSGNGMGGLGIDFESIMGNSGISTGNSNDVTYTVRIGVDTPCEELRIGMTAKLSIILRKNENVLSVPYHAVQEKEDKTYYIEEVTGEDKDGNYITREVVVTKGLESDYYVEVLGDKVKEGMTILVPKAEGSSILEQMLEQSGATGGI